MKGIEPGHAHEDVRARAAIAVMLRQVEDQPPSGNLHVDGRVVVKAMLPTDGEAQEADVELLGLLDAEDAQDRNGLEHLQRYFCHASGTGPTGAHHQDSSNCGPR